LAPSAGIERVICSGCRFTHAHIIGLQDRYNRISFIDDCQYAADGRRGLQSSVSLLSSLQHHGQERRLVADRQLLPIYGYGTVFPTD